MIQKKNVYYIDESILVEKKISNITFNRDEHAIINLYNERSRIKLIFSLKQTLQFLNEEDNKEDNMIDTIKILIKKLNYLTDDDYIRIFSFVPLPYDNELLEHAAVEVTK